MKPSLKYILGVTVLSLSLTLASSANAQTATSSARGQKIQDRGDSAITNRVDRLNALLTRLSDMKNLSSDEKTSFQATVESNISSLQTLESKIAADTTTAEKKADAATITKSYRIYALIIPQLNILSAADRIDSLVATYTDLGSKFDARISALTDTTLQATLTSTVSDFKAKIADAKSQADAATNEIASLVPDQGNKTTMTSNTTALKDALSKIKAARADLETARTDAKTIASSLKGKGQTATSTQSQ